MKSNQAKTPTQSKGTSTRRRPISRRTFLKAASAGSAAAGVAARVHAAKFKGATPIAASSSAILRGLTAYDPDLILLLNRITGGFSVAEYQYAQSLGGYEAYLDEQLNQYQTLVGPANDPALWNRLALYDITDKSALEIWQMYEPQPFIAEGQTTSIQVLFNVYAKAQLYYRMFQFWNHHLNIDINSTNEQDFILWPFLRDVILPHALGNFEDLIRASAHGAAMLRYLNNFLNNKNGIDENYARELLELYTLGVDNGYDEMDINYVAKILTGWSACLDLNTGMCSEGATMFELGDFWFKANSHNDTEIKTVMGRDFGPGGKEEGDELITFLTHLPNCAEFIAGKLCQFFLGVIPSDIQAMVAHEYLNNSVAIGDIPSMLAIILHRDVLTQYAQPKFRRPMDLMTGSLRAVEADIDPQGSSTTDLMRALMSDLNTMGMQPNFWEPPNGPFDSDVWAEGGSLTRWQYLDKLATNGSSEVINFNVADLLTSVGANLPGQQAQGLNEVLTGGQMEAKEVEAIQDYIGLSTSEATYKNALAFALQLPTYQFI